MFSRRGGHRPTRHHRERVDASSIAGSEIIVRRLSKIPMPTSVATPKQTQKQKQRRTRETRQHNEMNSRGGGKTKTTAMMHRDPSGKKIMIHHREPSGLRASDIDTRQESSDSSAHNVDSVSNTSQWTSTSSSSTSRFTSISNTQSTIATSSSYASSSTVQSLTVPNEVTNAVEAQVLHSLTKSDANFSSSYSRMNRSTSYAAKLRGDCIATCMPRVNNLPKKKNPEASTADHHHHPTKHELESIPEVLIPELSEEEVVASDNEEDHQIDLIELEGMDAEVIDLAEGKAKSKELADSVLTWSALGIFLSSPAPKSVAKKNRKMSREAAQSLWENSEGDASDTNKDDINIVPSPLSYECHGDNIVPDVEELLSDEPPLISTVCAWGALASLLESYSPASVVEMKTQDRHSVKTLWADDNSKDEDLDSHHRSVSASARTNNKQINKSQQQQTRSKKGIKERNSSNNIETSDNNRTRLRIVRNCNNISHSKLNVQAAQQPPLHSRRSNDVVSKPNSQAASLERFILSRPTNNTRHFTASVADMRLPHVSTDITLKSCLSSKKSLTENNKKNKEFKASRNVSFSHLKIREYEVTLGDNPSVSAGPPISLGWCYNPEEKMSPIRDFGNYESPPRRSRSEFRLSEHERGVSLMINANVSMKDLYDSLQSTAAARIERKESIIELLKTSTRKEVGRFNCFAYYLQGKGIRE